MRIELTHLAGRDNRGVRFGFRKWKARCEGTFHRPYDARAHCTSARRLDAVTDPTAIASRTSIICFHRQGGVSLGLEQTSLPLSPALFPAEWGQ